MTRMGAMGLALGLIVLAHPAQAGAPSPSAGPRGCEREATSSATFAVVKTIPVGNGPQGVAIDSVDDTVYVTNTNSNTMSVIDGVSATVVSTVTGFLEPAGIAVNQRSNTVYVVNADDSSIAVLEDGARGNRQTLKLGGLAWDVGVDQDDDTVYATINTGSATAGSVAVIDGSRHQVSTVVPIADNNPLALSVNSSEDRVYVVGENSTAVAVMDGRISAVDDTIALAGDFWGVAVHEADDTAYVTRYEESGSVSYISGRANSIAQTVSTRAYPWGIAVAQSANLVYVTNGQFDGVAVLDARTGATVVQSISVGAYPVALDVDQAGANAGMAYVANSDGGSVSVLGSVHPRVASASGSAGAVARISVHSPYAAFALDGATVARVCFESRLDGTVRRGLHLRDLSGNTWKVTVPRALPPGAYTVSVEFAGGQAARAGTYRIRTSG